MATAANDQPSAHFGSAVERGLPPPPFEGVQVLTRDAAGHVLLVTVLADSGPAARFSPRA